MSILSRLFGGSPLGLSQQLGAYPLRNGEIGPLLVILGIQNESRETVEISSVRITPKNTSEPLDITLKGEAPTGLGAGQDVRYEVRAKELAGACRAAGLTGTPKLTFVVRDGEGDEHHHDFTLRVDEYLALKDE